MLLSLIRYIKTLHSKALYFESVDVNGMVTSSKWGRYGVRTFFVIISVFIITKVDSGFSNEFVSYFSSVLSILVGLFITALVFSFDKFYLPKDTNEKIYNINLDQFDNENNGIDEKNYKIALKEISEPNAKQQLWDTQSYNYSMQFSYVTGYNIVLCIILILILSLNTLFETLKDTKISEYYFTINAISMKSICIFFEALFIICQRFFVLYLIFIVMYKTLFIVSSMVQYNIFKMKQQ